MPTSRIPLRFGEGLDRESGIQVVEPNTFHDLRNCFLHSGKVIVRNGFSAAGAGEFEEVDFLLNGLGMRGEQLGIVVGWNATEETCYVYRCAPDLSTVDLIGEWENDKGWGDTVPRVILAEVYGRVFMAHDEPSVGQRAATIYYDATAGDLTFLFSTWADGTAGESAGESNPESVSPPPGEDRIRFRGVARHLSYLCGWGFGDAIEPRPELLRISLPDDPTTFDPNHYFICGDRDDAVIGGRSVGGEPGVFKVWKRQEAYDLLGSSRRNFALFLADSSFGLVAGRATVDIGNGTVIAWSEEGPRLWAGRGASQSLEVPLGLDEWEPDDLPAEGEEEYAYGLFIPRERVAWFVFNRRVYALTVRNPHPSRWRWSYQQLPWDTYGGMTFFEGELASTAPTGYPAYNLTEGESASFTNPTVPGGTFADVSWRNFNQDGDETVEVWLQEVVPGSGEASEAGGVYSGATDFSEFSVGSGIPAGITRWGESGEDPTTHAIANDASEGNYFSMDGHSQFSTFGQWGYGLDSLAAAAPSSDFGETLARVWIEDPAQASKKIIGGAMNIVGELTGDFECWVGTIQMKSGDFESQIIQQNAGGGGNLGTGGDLQEAEQVGVWVWIRAQALEDGSGNVNYKVKAWYGSLDDEPAGWDAETDGQTDSPGVHANTGEAVGWAMPGNSSTAEQRIAFLAFTTDPTTTATPSEVSTEEGEWFLAGSFPVSTLVQQTERVTGLTSGTQYNVALRYRRGLTYNAGAEDDSDPSAWPSISQGTFTTTLDNPTISSAVWARTGGAAEGITLTIEPDPDNSDSDVNIYRRASTESEATLLTTLSAPHADPLEHEDTTIDGEKIYYYSVTHDNGTSESPFSDETRVWSGPADKPVRTYLNEFVEGYTVGFTLDAVNDVEVHDTYDDAGGTATTFSLRDTEEDAAVSDEISVTLLANVDAEDGASFAAKLRVKETAFTVDDYGEFSTAFPVNVEGSEFE